MTIKPRKVLPDPVTTYSGVEDKPGRNQFLQGLRLDIYQFIADNPGVTRSEVWTGLKLRSSSATARIKELIDEGLVYETGDRKRTKSGIRSRQLFVAEERRAGALRDRVRVRVSIYVDPQGRYFADADVIGGDVLMLDAVKIMDKDITIMVPKPQEVNTSVTKDVVTKMGTAEVRSSKDLTIEGDYEIVKD